MDLKWNENKLNNDISDMILCKEPCYNTIIRKGDMYVHQRLHK